MALAYKLVEMGNACEYQRRQDLKAAPPRHGRKDHGQRQQSDAACSGITWREGEGMGRRDAAVATSAFMGT